MKRRKSKTLTGRRPRGPRGGGALAAPGAGSSAPLALPAATTAYWDARLMRFAGRPLVEGQRVVRWQDEIERVDAYGDELPGLDLTGGGDPEPTYSAAGLGGGPGVTIADEGNLSGAYGGSIVMPWQPIGENHLWLLLQSTSGGEWVSEGYGDWRQLWRIGISFNFYEIILQVHKEGHLRVYRPEPDYRLDDEFEEDTPGKLVQTGPTAIHDGEAHLVEVRTRFDAARGLVWGIALDGTLLAEAADPGGHAIHSSHGNIKIAGAGYNRLGPPCRVGMTLTANGAVSSEEIARLEASITDAWRVPALDDGEGDDDGEDGQEGGGASGSALWWLLGAGAFGLGAYSYFSGGDEKPATDTGSGKPAPTNCAGMMKTAKDSTEKRPSENRDEST